MGAGDNTVTVASVGSLQAPGYLQVDGDDDQKVEFIRYNAIAGNSLTGVTRGLAGSAAGATSHLQGVPVRSVIVHQVSDDVFTDVEDLELSVTEVETDLDDHESSGSAHPLATPSANGMMSASDKGILNVLEDLRANGTDDLRLLDIEDALHHLSAHDDPGENLPGMWLWPDTNPAEGEPIFGVMSSGTAERFRVDHGALQVHARSSGLFVAEDRVLTRGDNMREQVVDFRQEQETDSQSLTGSWANYFGLTFQRPASWSTFFIMAFASVTFEAGPFAGLWRPRLRIAASGSTSGVAQIPPRPGSEAFSLSMVMPVGGLTSNTNVNVQIQDGENDPDSDGTANNGSLLVMAVKNS